MALALKAIAVGLQAFQFKLADGAVSGWSTGHLTLNPTELRRPFGNLIIFNLLE
jgi:hypothetical protein